MRGPLRAPLWALLVLGTMTGAMLLPWFVYPGVQAGFERVLLAFFAFVLALACSIFADLHRLRPRPILALATATLAVGAAVIGFGVWYPATLIAGVFFAGALRCNGTAAARGIAGIRAVAVASGSVVTAAAFALPVFERSLSRLGSFEGTVALGGVAGFALTAALIAAET